MTSHNKSLAGHAALVTGSSSGIGKATIRRLARQGAFVGVHCHRSRTEAEAVLAEIREDGGDGVLLQSDLADAEQCVRLVAEMVEAAGRLDILVNNAGTVVERSKIEECSLELWHQVINVNLTSAFLVTKTAIPHLRASGRGAIVNVLSLSVQTGGANGGGVYAIAKGGLQVMTRTLARELAPAVRTNAIMPGVIETRHHEDFTTPQRMEQYRQETPLGRNGTAEEVAAAIAFLVSDEAAFLNGALLDINGGRFLR
jgi:3-oxoacyl-[acyl-carrier protein] reductase